LGGDVRKVLTIAFSVLTIVVLARPASARVFLFDDFRGDFSVWSLNSVEDLGPYISGLGNMRGNNPFGRSGDYGDAGRFGGLVEALFTPWASTFDSAGVNLVAVILVTKDRDTEPARGNDRIGGKPDMDGSKPVIVNDKPRLDGKFDTPFRPVSNGLVSNGPRSSGPASSGSKPTSVPEPSSLALLLTAGVAMIAGSRGRMKRR
jgi:hypothetical protein